MKEFKCKVRFDKSNNVIAYHYLTNIENLKEGDLVVVHARNDFALAHFVSYCDFNETEKTKWIIQKVDLSAHYDRIARKEKIKLIKEKLEEERKRTEEIQIYEILAEKNPEIKKLLNELKDLI